MRMGTFPNVREIGEIKRTVQEYYGWIYIASE